MARRSLLQRLRAWRHRDKGPWTWSTAAIWLAIVLMLASTAVPWAAKSVDEVMWGGIDGQEGHYYLDRLDVRWDDWGQPDPEGNREALQHAKSWRYYDRMPNINLPEGGFANDAGELATAGAAGAFLAGLIHGLRPGPRRQRIGLWALTLASIAYGVGGLVFFVSAGIHAAGWTAQEVGPFVPGIGSLLAAIGLTSWAVAAKRIGFVKAPELDLPALPDAVDAESLPKTRVEWQPAP